MNHGEDPKPEQGDFDSKPEDGCQALPPVIYPQESPTKPQPIQFESQFPWPSILIAGGLLAMGAVMATPWNVQGSTRGCRIEWSKRQAEIDRALDLNTTEAEIPNDE